MVMIADRYRLAPACCLVCRQSKTPCVDLQSEDDDLAYQVTHLYLCRDCVRDLGVMLGRWAVAQGRPLGWSIVQDSELAELVADLDVARAEIGRLEERSTLFEDLQAKLDLLSEPVEVPAS